MIGESRNVFTKRLLGEKHIIGIMCENPGGGHALLAPHCQRLWQYSLYV